MKTRSYQSRVRPPLLFVVAALVSGLSAIALVHGAGVKDKNSSSNVVLPLDETELSRSAVPGTSFAPIVKKVAPAVVKIETATTVKSTSMPQAPSQTDPFWRRFFGDEFGHLIPQHPMGPFHEHGLGSGVIVTKDGYILTNNHVVDNATDVKVTLPDGREFTAKVIGRDSKSDLAVVKIDATDLPVLAMADSDKVQVGDVALAVGNPFGVGQTVTKGIVSATGRGNMGIEDYEDFIQTDAAINPGNSGGALVDSEGRLIGINTAILSRSGGNQGVGFAIPSDLARNVMESLVRTGHVTRGYLGVMIQDVTPALAKEFKLPNTQGALVGDVVSYGPAAKAGLKDGDVILDYAGKKVTDSRHLKLQVADSSPGATVPVKVWRDGSTKNLDVTLKQLPGSEPLASNNSSKEKDNGTLNGVAVTDADQNTRQEFNLPKGITGAVVTQVDPASAAAEAGVKPGDVIEEINHHPVKSADEAVKLTENVKDKQTLLRLWADGGSRYVVVDETGKPG
jgi:serine protease Do